ncbi:hypothetical protein SUNI508_05830 [Seiridium unicorne]|uniref:NB-ARC domain-containing protein n=1 Tax=Seiridium unicorne TaxID=138068 RepID=A0ABR2V309_9PEZI
MDEKLRLELLTLELEVNLSTAGRCGVSVKIFDRSDNEKADGMRRDLLRLGKQALERGLLTKRLQSPNPEKVFNQLPLPVKASTRADKPGAMESVMQRTHSPVETLVENEPRSSQTSLSSRSFGTFGTANLERRITNLLFLLVDMTSAAPLQHRTLPDLLHQVNNLKTISDALSKSSAEQGLQGYPDATQDQLWDSVRIISDRCCDDVLLPLREKFEQESNGSLRAPSRPEKGWTFELTYETTLQLLHYQTGVLQVLHKALQLGTERRKARRGSIPQIVYDIASTITPLVAKLVSELDQIDLFYPGQDEGVTDMRNALLKALSVAKGVPVKSVNIHWQIPRQSNSLYTGRREQLQAITRAFATSAMGHKRFVIQGMPGSGKSDLALRYAEENAIYYWGVFWLDASSRNNIAESYAEIGKLGGVEPIEKAAKNWLSNRHVSYTWLLIVDNADDSDVPLDELFPPYASGHAQGAILVTTRNPGILEYGNTGRLELKEMEGKDANELLLKAANVQEPWTGKLELAKKICQHLHYLPLALLHAGKAIAKGLCELGTYISYFNDHAHRIRNRRSRRRDRSTSRVKQRTIEDDEHMAIFGSYEILYEWLEGKAAAQNHVGRYQNALQLLQIISYMHFQNIRLDVLINAATVPLLEEEAQHKKEADEKRVLQRIGPLPKPSYKAQLQDMAIRIRRHKLFASKPAIPEVLKNLDELKVTELRTMVNGDLRWAFSLLVDRGLLDRGENREGTNRDQQRYHMHPLVHQWLRERPETSVAEGALHCQIATTVLCKAVKLVAKDDDGEMAMRRDMKPHIDNVLHYSERLRGHLEENRAKKRVYPWSLWFGNSEPLGLTPSSAEEYGRFSKVYLECGAFADAERLLQKVQSYLTTRLGNDHPLTQRVKEGLAAARWSQTFWNDSAKLLRQVYVSRKRALGPNHPATIDITNKLGMSVLSQGRITESLSLHNDAKRALIEVHNDRHPEVFKTTGLIGRCYFYRMNWALSIELHREASRNLRALLKEGRLGDLTELDVLHSEEDLAMGLIRLEHNDCPDVERVYQEALTIMQGVMERRIELLGRDAPFTLIARANYGRILSKCGQFLEADEVMRKALQTAEENHGENHLAVLAGKCWYGQVLLENGQLLRAQRHFEQASKIEYYEKAAHDDGEHPDRIMAVWLLVRCLKLQERYDEALKLCDELNTNIPRIGGKGYGKGHKFSELLPGIIKDIEEQKARSQSVSSEQHAAKRITYLLRGAEGLLIYLTAAAGAGGASWRVHPAGHGAAGPPL